MRTITWLHLSDWHQKTPAEGGSDDREQVFSKLLEDIEERERIDTRLKKIDFIVFSGDLAFSGKYDQYQQAKTNFLKDIKVVTGVKEDDKIFFVPGNHDLDDKKLVEIKKIGKTHVDEPIPQNNEGYISLWNDECRNDSGFINLLRYPFSSFRDFASEYANQRDADYVSYKRLFIEGSSIGLFGFNSAIMSRRIIKNNENEPTVDANEKDRLILGTLQMEKARKLLKKHKNEINIAVFHHPIDWLIQSEKRSTILTLNNYFDFLLCGHTHDYQLPQNQQGSCIFINAGSAYDSKPWVNSYNFCHLDLESRKATLYQRIWDARLPKWKRNEILSGDEIKDTNQEFNLRKPRDVTPPKVIDGKDKPTLDKHWDGVIEAILEGSVIPVLGADINLVGRLDSFPWNWNVSGKLPPSNLEITAYIEKKIIHDDDRKSSIHCPFCQIEEDYFPPQECPLHTKYNINWIDLPYLTQNIWARHQEGNERKFLTDSIKSINSNTYDSNLVHDFFAGIFLDKYGYYKKIGQKSDSPLSTPQTITKFPLIVTTCIDTTIENRFKKIDKPFGVLIYNNSKNQYLFRPFDYKDGINEKSDVSPKCEWKTIDKQQDENYLDRMPIILRMFGSMEDCKGDFTFTEDSFIDYMLQSKDNTTKLMEKLMSKLKNGKLWFLGYNPSYWYLRILLRKIRSANNTRLWFAVQEKPSRFELKLWKDINVNFCSHHDSGFLGMKKYIEYIDEKLKEKTL